MKKDVLRRYFISIIIDQFITILFIVLPLLMIDYYGSRYEGVWRFLILICSIIIFACYFISDLLFKNKSLGKAITRIEVKFLYNNVSLRVRSIIIRRFMELQHHLLLNRNFEKIAKDIDVRTKTSIIVKKRIK